MTKTGRLRCDRCGRCIGRVPAIFTGSSRTLCLGCAHPAYAVASKDEA